jgi:prefoldin subunit 5
MPEKQNIDELEDLFKKFDEKFSECEQKFSTLEKQIQEFRQSEMQQESDDTSPPDTSN